MSVYYNEHDPAAAAWLRELIRRNLIAPGDVDERSIVDVRPTELMGYTQCHFFAGIGTWSYALRAAGWPDDRPVWTGSPPCQPFSAAGRRGGYDDDRHLAPQWLDLIRQRRPPVVFGEQVASAFTNAKHPWVDDLQDALEAENYAVGKIVLPACSVGAPHIRQRGWFVAQRVEYAKHEHKRSAGQQQEGARDAAGAGEACGLGNASQPGLEGHGGHCDDQHEQGRNDAQPCGSVAEAGGDGRLADADCGERECQQDKQSAGIQPQVHGAAKTREGLGDSGASLCERTGTGHNHWRAADWLFCRDGKFRPVEPGTFPLAHGAAARVVSVCPHCKTRTTVDEELRYMRHAHDRHEGCGSTEVLQSSVHGEGVRGESDQSGQREIPGATSVSGNGMHAMRLNRASGAPSQGWGCDEQRPGECGGAVSDLPSRRTSATMPDADLHRMWEAVQGTEAAEQDLFCSVCKKVGPHQLRKEMGGSRVTRLRGYGNGIVAQVAEEVIRAYMET